MHPPHILVVDDDETIREVAQMALEVVGGWRVTTVSSGGEALRVAADTQPDAILLDVMMPVLDGPAILSELQTDRQTREIPVVFLTAKVTPGREGEWEADGAVGTIAKPFDPMTLADDVNRLLGRES